MTTIKIKSPKNKEIIDMIINLSRLDLSKSPNSSRNNKNKIIMVKCLVCLIYFVGLKIQNHE